MLPQNEKPLTKQEFDEWTTATKETFNSIDETLSVNLSEIKFKLICKYVITMIEATIRGRAWR